MSAEQTAQPDATVTSEVASPAPAAASTNRAGRSAEARELERQLEEMRNRLREAEQRADAAEQRAQENLDRWQRAQADLANFRRRSQFDREELEKYAVSALVGALLPVMDSFDRAWQTLPGSLRRLTWLSGVDMIDRQLRGTLMRIGLVEVEALGQPFDPATHEAIDQEEHEGQAYVVQVFQPGYKLFDRVIRPALVKVGPKPPEPEQPAQSAEPSESTGQPDAATAQTPEA